MTALPTTYRPRHAAVTLTERIEAVLAAIRSTREGLGPHLDQEDNR